MSRQHLSWRRLNISGISQLLLTRFWPNFECRFLNRCKLLWWHFSRQNMSWWYLSMSQLLLTQFWPNFLGPIFGGLNFCGPKFFRQKFSCPKFFWTKNYFCTQFTFYFLDPTFFWTNTSFTKIFWIKFFFSPELCWTTIVLTKNYLIKFFWPRFFVT